MIFSIKTQVWRINSSPVKRETQNRKQKSTEHKRLKEVSAMCVSSESEPRVNQKKAWTCCSQVGQEVLPETASLALEM